jgi:hypothetical protein
MERFGVRLHPAYLMDVIELATPTPLLTNLLWPLSTQVRPQFAPRLPAIYFSGVTSFGDNSRQNLRLTAKQLEPMLGSGRIKQRGNIERCEWIDGLATLRLTIWPLDLHCGPPHDNPSHAREPRLATGCHVEVETGFMLAVTAKEAVWIKRFVPVAKITFTSQSVGENVLEFVREPIAESGGIAGMVGYSEDCAALIFYTSQLYIIPVADVLRFTVHRLLPAKGGGGSWLEVECLTQCPGVPMKTLTITSAPGADDLNDLAQSLALRARRPFALSAYTYDC